MALPKINVGTVAGDGTGEGMRDGFIKSNASFDAVDLNTDKVTFDSTSSTKLSGIDDNATANDTDANLLNRVNHTGTQIASTISDFESSVSANTDVTANTSKVGITPTQTSDITTNNSKVSFDSTS